MIKKKKKQQCFHSPAHPSCFLGVRQSRTLPVCILLFSFNVITVNPGLVTSNDIWRRFSQMENCCSFWSPVKSLGTNFAETWCTPKSSVKIVWHEPMDMPTSSANFSDSQLMISMVNVFHLGNQRFNLEVGRPHCSSSIEVLPFLKHLNTSLVIISVSFTQHVMGFCRCFPYFETEFNTNSLLLYWLHTTCYKLTTHSINLPWTELFA
jgi:hypothetical protein